MQIDWTLNPVAIAQIILMVVGGMGVLFGVLYSVKTLKADVREIKNDVKVLTASVASVRVVETKIEDDRRVTAEFREWFRREADRLWSAINSINTVGRTVMPL